MEELNYIISKYGTTLKAKDIAELQKCDLRKVYSLNLPRLPGYSETRVNTTNYFIWCLANGDNAKYDTYLKLYLESRLTP